MQTPSAPAPAGHYSQAVVHNGLVYVAGQLSVDPKTGGRLAGPVEEQTERTLGNVAEILEAVEAAGPRAQGHHLRLRRQPVGRCE